MLIFERQCKGRDSYFTNGIFNLMVMLVIAAEWSHCYCNSEKNIDSCLKNGCKRRSNVMRQSQVMRMCCLKVAPDTHVAISLLNMIKDCWNWSTKQEAMLNINMLLQWHFCQKKKMCLQITLIVTNIIRTTV